MEVSTLHLIHPAYYLASQIPLTLAHFTPPLAVTTPTLSVQTSPLYNTTYFSTRASSYGAKAFCYYKYGGGIASLGALSTLLRPQDNAVTASITTLSTLYAAPTEQVWGTGDHPFLRGLPHFGVSCQEETTLSVAIALAGGISPDQDDRSKIEQD